MYKAFSWRTSLVGAFFVLFLMGTTTSCISRKKLTYLQTPTEVSDSMVFQLKRSDYKLQINDIVNIDIRSINPEASALFNPGGDVRQNLVAGDIIFYLQGYSVDNEGYIEIPVVGRVYVVGKTIKELKETLDQKLTEYFQENSVSTRVQLAGIRFSVIGDINRPGKYVVYQNQAHIFDALALSGDISIVGDRRQVQIIRQYPEGLKLYEVDLTDVNALSDPRFFIQPNDIINVKPMRVKTWGIGTTGWQTISLSLATLASALTIVLTLQRL